jgi:hypothetical protein
MDEMDAGFPKVKTPPALNSQLSTRRPSALEAKTLKRYENSDRPQHFLKISSFFC